MIIDFHTHAFPDSLAQIAVEALAKHSGVEPFFNGTAAGLSALTAANGISCSVVANIATNEKQQRNVNNFAASLSQYENLVGFGSVYPASESAFAEVDRISSLGLKGIKLHPDYQNFFVDDPAFFPLYRHIAHARLITLFHAGSDIGLPEPTHCTPERLAAALPYFENAPVVAAHLGGYMYWHSVEQHLAGKDIYFDTSYTAGRIPLPQAKRLIAAHGTHRILFGSDLPWSSAKTEKRFVEALGLSDTDTERVLGGNAAALLGLD